MINKYYQLIKPGIVFGNLISVIGGFLLAAQGHIDYFLFTTTMVGVSLVVASGCVFNNLIDLDIDRKMERTKNRVLAKGLISKKHSIIYAILLGISGFWLLYSYINPIAISLAVWGFIIYVSIYSLYMKRKSVYGTLIGSLSGASPPMIGYCAVSNQFNKCTLILMLIFSLWQMAHSYAIAIFRLDDYQLASIPVFPVKHGVEMTKRYIIIYIISFIAASIMLAASGYVGYEYLIVTTSINILWLIIALVGYHTASNNILWAQKMFIFSVIAITCLSIMISIDFTIQ